MNHVDDSLLPLRTLIDPLGAIPRAVEARRWGLGLLLVSVLSAGSATVIATRLDTSGPVLAALAASGELARASEREISEAVEQAQRVALVAGVARGVVLMPLWTLAIAVILKVAAWLLSRSSTFPALFTGASLAMLPVAVFHAVELVAAQRQVRLTEASAGVLVPTSLSAFIEVAPPWSRVLGAADAVGVWSALVLGLAFAAATQWTAVKGALFGIVMYVLYAGAFVIGLPGLLAEGSVLGGLLR